MRLSKKVGIIIGIGVIIALLVIVVMVYFQQVGEQQELNEQWDAAEVLSMKLEIDEEDLEDQLAQAQSLLGASQAKFPQAIKSIEYGEDFFKIAYGQDLYSMAAGCGVELIHLNASKPSDKTVGTVTYSVSSFGVIINGEVENMLEFIDAIGTGIDYKLSWSFQLPWSVDVKSINMNIANKTTSINLDIYGYRR